MHLALGLVLNKHKLNSGLGVEGWINLQIKGGAVENDTLGGHKLVVAGTGRWSIDFHAQFGGLDQGEDAFGCKNAGAVTRADIAQAGNRANSSRSQQCTAVDDHKTIGDGTVHNQAAIVDHGVAGVGTSAGKGECSRTLEGDSTIGAGGEVGIE